MMHLNKTMQNTARGLFPDKLLNKTMQNTAHSLFYDKLWVMGDHELMCQIVCVAQFICHFVKSFYFLYISLSPLVQCVVLYQSDAPSTSFWFYKNNNITSQEFTLNILLCFQCFAYFTYNNFAYLIFFILVREIDEETRLDDEPVSYFVFCETFYIFRFFVT